LETEIRSEKLKEKKYLLYKIQTKHRDWKNVPRCAFLIGAGCSSPTIPTGSEIIGICKYLCFIKDRFPLDAVEVEANFFESTDLKMLKEFLTKKNAETDFEKYVVEMEEELLSDLRLKKDSLMSKIPESTNNEWDKYEQFFLKDAKYGYWMDKYNSSPKDRQKFIQALIENCTASGAYIILALLIEKGFINNILTTNFDDFINDTLLYYTSAKPRFYADDELCEYISFHSQQPNIIKLHGDYRYANIKNTTDETNGLNFKMEEKLKELLQNLDLIVIGYSGSDYSIMKVLEEVKTPNSELIWCGLDHSKVHWRVANLINKNKNAYFINIKGFDDVIKDFYLDLVKSPPDLLSKAKKRQEEINQYVKQFNNELQSKETDGQEKTRLVKQESVWELVNKAYLENDQDKKIQLYTHALKISPKNWMIHMLRGLIYKEKGNTEMAFKDMDMALSLDPNNPEIYFNRGFLFDEEGRLDEAMEDYEKAQNLGFKDLAMLYNNYAVVSRKKKNFNLAIKFVEKGLAYNSNLFNLYGTLALIYSDMGKDEEFYKNIELCLQKGCVIDNYLDKDPGFKRFLDSGRFKDILKKYE